MDWKPKTVRYIAFFDIMGFENFVYRNSHSDVEKRMLDLHSIIKQVDRKKFAIQESEYEIRFNVFSDSILIGTNDKSDRGALNIIVFSNWLLKECFMKNIPIKGALSYGLSTFDTDKSLYFGKPLIDAYRLQNEVYMYGCVIDNNFQKRFFEIKDDILKKRIDRNLIHAEIPFKVGEINHIALDWYTFMHDYQFKNYEIEDLVSEMYLGVSGNTRKYVDNTFKFIKKVKEWRSSLISENNSNNTKQH